MKITKCFKASAAIILSLLLAGLVWLPCFAAEGGSVVTGYSVSSKSVSKYDVVSITVYVKNFDMDTQDVASSSSIEVTHCLDSFSGVSQPRVRITSKSGEKLCYAVVFNNCCCSDIAGNFNFIVTYNGDVSERESLSFTVAECGAAPDPAPEEPTTLPPEESTTEQPQESTTEPASLSQPAPLVRITRKDIAKKLAANTEFELCVVFENTNSPYAITGGVASFEPSEGLVLNENSSSKSLPNISVRSSKYITVKMKVASNAESAVQSVTVTCRYNYQTPEGILQGSETEKLNITVIPSGSAASPSGVQSATPNIIVTKYNYGAQSVAAGDKFNLSLEFKNTSKNLKVENIVMAVDAGEGLSITSSSNTFYYDSLAASGTLSQTLGLNLSANIATVGAKLDITFRYEYVDAGARSSTTSSESLSIPVYIPDRFTITPPDSIIAIANEEASVSLSYVNKSKSAVNNVEAVIQYDDESFYCEFPSQNLGNFEAGKSGTIDFIITPMAEGEASATAVITYETEMLETKTVEVPLTFSVEPAAEYIDEPFDEPIDEPEQGKMSVWAIVAIAVGAVVIVAAVIIVIKKKKKKKAAEIPTDFDWNTASPEKQEVKPDETN